MQPIALDTLLQQRYRILDNLGEGGFGRTYLATDRGRFDEYCAIKELTPISQSTLNLEKAKEFFKREASLLYQLQHPQIPRFWATFEEQDRLFLVQDYIAGKTYRTLLEERQSQHFSEAEVWRFLLQVLPVLGYIHSKGVIHRDLPPDNIILRESDHLPVLIDFGVVKEFANKLQAAPIEKPGMLAVGKPGYAPPEQLAAGQAYPSSDLYSLAVTAIVLLTGKEPSDLFEGDRMNWTWRRWVHISDGLVNVLHRMLSNRPSERYSSAVDVFQALQSLSIPNAQPPEPSEPRASHPSKMPTRAVGGNHHPPSMADRVYSAITNINVKSVWEKPQVFIPVGVLISLLAGLAGWFGVKLTTQPSGITSGSEQTVQPQPSDSTPPKPADFNNPTISKGTSVVDPNEPIQPVLGQAIVREGKIDGSTSIRYKLAGTTGQNLDISTGSDRVLMTILSPLSLPIDNPTSERVAGWRGQIASPGEYTIELRPIQGLQGSGFPYRLTISQLAETPETRPSSVGIPGSEPNPIPVIPGNNSGINTLPSNSAPSSGDSLTPTFTPSPVPIEIPTTRPRRVKVEEIPPSNRNGDNSTESKPSRRVRVRRSPQSDRTESTPKPPKRNRSPVDNTGTPSEAQPSPSPETPSVDIEVPSPSSTITPKPDPNSTDRVPPNNSNDSNHNRSNKTTQPSPDPSSTPTTAPDSE